jgi:hypothetical protein
MNGTQEWVHDSDGVNAFSKFLAEEREPKEVMTLDLGSHGLSFKYCALKHFAAPTQLLAT